jgi:adenylate cyclase
MSFSPPRLTPVWRFLRRYRGAGLGLVCAVLAWGLTGFPFTQGVEDWVFDGTFFYRGTRHTSTRVVIIGLDEKSLEEIDKPLIYISPELAKVTQYSLDQGATVVGIDLMIPIDKSNDPVINGFTGDGDGKIFGNVVKSGHVVLPIRESEGKTLMPISQWWFFKQMEKSENTDFGFTDLDEDGDQFIRQQSLFLGDGESSFPQFALALYARSFTPPLKVDRDPATGMPRVGGHRIRTDSDGRMRINYVGPPGTFPVIPFPVIPFREALRAAREGRPLDVRGAAVIIGTTARSMQDYHATPYSNHYARYESSPTPGRMSGPELQANIFATIHDRAYITTPWWLNRILLLVVFGILLGIAFARLSLEAGFVLAIAHHFAWKALAVSALTQGIRLEVISILVLGGLIYAATFIRRWRQLRRMFGVVKSVEVIRALEADSERLNPGGEERIVTVLFADIRKFTDFSEQHSPAEVVALQKSYFAAIVPCIEKAGGTVTCYMGDGIMALFGAPAHQPDHAVRAVRAVEAMVRAVHKARPTWDKLDRIGVWRAQGGLRIGVGIHTGPAVVGAVGSPGRLDYSAIGDVVNAASRLEGANKEQGTEVLLSNDTLGRVPAEEQAALKLGEPVQVTVKGRKKEITAYPLIVE